MKKTDKEIIDLYFARDEAAIKETDYAYGRYLFQISFRVLSDTEDAKENVNDTYLKAWNAMPPQRPRALQLFLSRLCRNGAIDLYRTFHTQKRAGSRYAECIDEWADYIPGGDTPEEASETAELAGSINAFLHTLDKEKRNVFIGRYFYMDSVKEIAGYTGLSTANVKTILSRTRKQLAEKLEKEGYVL